MSYFLSPTESSLARFTTLNYWHHNLRDALSDVVLDAFPERYAWLYESERTGSWQACFPDKQIIGTAGLMFRRMFVDGRSIESGRAIDLNINQDLSSQTPVVLLHQALAEAAGNIGLEMLYAFSEILSEPTLIQAGYRRIGVLKRWVKPLRNDALLQRRMVNKCARRVILLISDMATLYSSAKSSCWQSDDEKIEVTDHFDERFDHLWERASSQFDVIGERTSDYLNWRFCECPQRTNRIVTLCNRDGELLAYLVYHRHEETIYLNDFLFVEKNHFQHLLTQFCSLARDEHASSVQVTMSMECPSVSKALSSAGFWPRSTGWVALAYAPNQPTWIDSRNWFITRADVDTDL